MRHSRSELLVGAGALLVLAGLLWQGVDFVHDRYYPKMYRVTAYFTDARGLNEGTPIRMAGVPCGMVVAIAPPGIDKAVPAAAEHDFTGLSPAEKGERVRLVLGINDHFRIRTHKVRVAALGLIQERYIAIDVGEEDPVPEKGSELLGELDVSLDSVGDAAKGVQKVFADPALMTRIDSFSGGMQTLLAGFGRIVDHGPDALKRAQETLRVGGDDASVMTARVKDAGDRTGANWEGMSAGIDRDREQVRRIRDDFDAISKEAGELRARFDSGQGTLGKMASSTDLADSLAGVRGSKDKLAFDRRNAKPMSRSTRTILKVAKTVFFFLKPSHH